MAFSAGRASASGRSVCWRRHRQIAFGCRVRRGPRWRRGVSRGRAFHDSMGLFVDGAGPPTARPPSPSRMSATAIRRSRLPAPKVPAPTFNPATRQSAQDVTAYPGHTFWPITRFTVPHCLRWQADTRYLRFEGLISRSRNIYLRFKGLPECGTRSISGCSALESCDSHGVYTRAPTPRNAVRCLSEPQSTPRNEDSPRISRSSFERRMCSTVKHADEQACQRRNDPSQLKLLQRQHVQYGL